jgi:hypothetical protein
MTQSARQHNVKGSYSPIPKQAYESPKLTPSGRMAEVTQKSNPTVDIGNGQVGNHGHL